MPAISAMSPSRMKGSNENDEALPATSTSLNELQSTHSGGRTMNRDGNLNSDRCSRPETSTAGATTTIVNHERSGRLDGGRNNSDDEDLKRTMEEEERLKAEAELLEKIPRELAWFNGAGRVDNTILQRSRLRVRRKQDTTSATVPSQSKSQLHHSTQQQQRSKRPKLNTSREQLSGTAAVPSPGDLAQSSSVKKNRTPGSMGRRRSSRLKDAPKAKGVAGNPGPSFNPPAKIDEFDFDPQNPMEARSPEIDDEFSFDHEANEENYVANTQKKKARKILVVGSAQRTSASQAMPASHSHSTTSGNGGSAVPLPTKTASIANREENTQQPKQSMQSAENANDPCCDLNALDGKAAVSVSTATMSPCEGSGSHKSMASHAAEDLVNDDRSWSSENSESFFPITRTEDSFRLLNVAMGGHLGQENPQVDDVLTRCSFFYSYGGQQCPNQCFDDTLFCFVHANVDDHHKPPPLDGTASASRPIYSMQDPITGDLLSDDKGVSNSFPASGFARAGANPDYDSSDYSDSEHDEDSKDASIRAEADQQSRANGVYTGSEYNKLFRMCEQRFGNQLEEIEDGNPIRAANQNVENRDSTWQNRAQYGRLLPKANKKLMKILEVSKEDTFLDIGHGVGNSCFYAAFCIGCKARGLELVENRFNVSGLFCEQLELFNQRNENRCVGSIDLKLGRLEDPVNERFQTEDVTRVYVNNFNGVFSERSDVRKVGVYPDHVVAGLFTKLAVGSIMVTFYPLPLGPDQNKANELRRRAGLEESDNASFFKEEKESLGLARECVRWGAKETSCEETIWVYKYTRLEQTMGGGAAVFLCSNARCQYAREATPIGASGEDEEGRCISHMHCPVCCTSAHATRTRCKPKHQYST